MDQFTLHVQSALVRETGGLWDGRVFALAMTCSQDAISSSEQLSGKFSRDVRDRRCGPSLTYACLSSRVGLPKHDSLVKSLCRPN